MQPHKSTSEVPVKFTYSYLGKYPESNYDNVYNTYILVLFDIGVLLALFPGTIRSGSVT